MNTSRPRRPRLALPFTVLSSRDTVRLVAGEDFRYSLGGPGLDEWLPAVLARCDGRHTVEELLSGLPPHQQSQASELIDRLYGERVLCDGSVELAHAAMRYRAAPEGCGALVERLQLAMGGNATPGEALPILCQDRLDYHTVLDFNRRCLAGSAPWLWATCGPLSRAYVSPLFRPDAGPCLECLVRQFQRLSPVPDLYEELIRHGRVGGEFVPVAQAESVWEIVAQLLVWKLSLVEHPSPPAALYRLHVIEIEALEISTHRVFSLPDCPACLSLR